MIAERLSTTHLCDLTLDLSERDLAILGSLAKHRWATTDQIRRLHFRAHASPIAAGKATYRVLNRLRRLRLVETRAGRVGGHGGGSSATVWHLSHAGWRLVHLRLGQAPRRYTDPSTTFLRHTLAITELAAELAAAPGLRVERFDTEPACWRQYPSTSTTHLRPDAYLITVMTHDGEQYEDHIFVEVDLSTESIPRILDKARTYHLYRQTGLEQQSIGVFPLVLFVTPDRARATAITGAIHHTADIPHEIFAATPAGTVAALLTTE